MTDPKRNLAVAEHVAGIAEAHGLPTMVIGAIALAAHGYVRATGDVDLGVNTTLDHLRQFVAALAADGYEVALREPDGDDPLGGVVDITGEFGIVQLVNYGGRFPAVIDDALAAAPVTVREGSSLRVVPLPHLVALKLYAGGLGSLSDVVGLLRANPDADLDAIAELCKRYRLRGFDTVRRELAVEP